MDRNARRLALSWVVSASLSARRAWIEMIDYVIDYANDASLSARRAWIEILISSRQVCLTCVALRKESVDRNRHANCKYIPTHVALRKESVDRNRLILLALGSLTVALRKESVDRNLHPS